MVRVTSRSLSLLRGPAQSSFLVVGCPVRSNHSLSCIPRCGFRLPLLEYSFHLFRCCRRLPLHSRALWCTMDTRLRLPDCKAWWGWNSRRLGIHTIPLASEDLFSL